MSQFAFVRRQWPEVFEAAERTDGAMTRSYDTP
jgi:hypothetical protein